MNENCITENVSKRAIRHNQLVCKYDISLADYEEMLSKQGGVCKICGGKNNNKTLSVDHNHKTGKIRGLLCFSCNTVLGCAKDRIGILAKAITYLLNTK